MIPGTYRRNLKRTTARRKPMPTYSEATIKTDLEKVTEAIQQLGYSRINPESLMALGDEIGDHPAAVRAAYRNVMAGFRALLAPAA
jgi:hypothetical protein